ncbi:hypothetical protein AAMO2058_000474400 [Amorphochlora amoebiformis]
MVGSARCRRRTRGASMGITLLSIVYMYVVRHQCGRIKQLGSGETHKKYKFVALVSGGKDSILAVLKALDRGHRLVGLANLAPDNASSHEMDSYMLQTVGHELIPEIAKNLGVDVYRRRTRGRRDEVEDLYSLLKLVKTRTGAEAVVSGAILSDYQRLRVEHVCSRLGLVSISPLWRQDGRFLMDDMCYHAHIDAIITKTAAGGLKPDRVLGKSIKELRSPLLTWASTYTSHPCGEGGEYETLVLDCPLYRNRLVLQNTKRIAEGQRFGDEGTSWLIPIGFRSIPKHIWLTFTRRFRLKLDYIGMETVAQLKRRIRKATFIPEKWMNIYHGNTLLRDDNTTIATFRIQNYDNLTILQREGVDEKVETDDWTQGEDDSDKDISRLINRALYLERHKNVRPCSETPEIGHDYGFDPNSPSQKDTIKVVWDVSPTANQTQKQFENSENVLKSEFDHSRSELKPSLAASYGVGRGLDASQAVNIAFDKVENRLMHQGFSLLDVIYTHMSLSNMDQFQAANLAYIDRIQRKHGRGGPPARCCIGIADSNNGVNESTVSLHCLAAKGGAEEGLHVQSISPWAPACIGPYSQAIRGPCGIVMLAGSIGLVPATMEMIRGGLVAELGRAMESNHAIARAFLSRSKNLNFRIVAWTLFRIEGEDGQRSLIDLSDVMSRYNIRRDPVIVTVDKLPRDANVETQVIGEIFKGLEDPIYSLHRSKWTYKTLPNGVILRWAFTDIWSVFQVYANTTVNTSWTAITKVFLSELECIDIPSTQIPILTKLLSTKRLDVQELKRLWPQNKTERICDIEELCRLNARRIWIGGGNADIALDVLFWKR